MHCSLKAIDALKKWKPAHSILSTEQTELIYIHNVSTVMSSDTISALKDFIVKTLGTTLAYSVSFHSRGYGCIIPESPKDIQTLWKTVVTKEARKLNFKGRILTLTWDNEPSACAIPVDLQSPTSITKDLELKRSWIMYPDQKLTRLIMKAAKDQVVNVSFPLFSESQQRRHTAILYFRDLKAREDMCPGILPVELSGTTFHLFVFKNQAKHPDDPNALRPANFFPKSMEPSKKKKKAIKF